MCEQNQDMRYAWKGFTTLTEGAGSFLTAVTLCYGECHAKIQALQNEPIDYGRSWWWYGSESAVVTT